MRPVLSDNAARIRRRLSLGAPHKENARLGKTHQLPLAANEKADHPLNDLAKLCHHLRRNLVGDQRRLGDATRSGIRQKLKDAATVVVKRERAQLPLRVTLEFWRPRPPRGFGGSWGDRSLHAATGEDTTACNLTLA